jgi:ribosomal protein L11 methyltransferase
MDWIEVKIETDGEFVEPLTGLILMAGIPGWVTDDPRDLRNYLNSPQAARWDYIEEGLLREEYRKTVIRAYVADNAQGRRQWRALRESLAAFRQDVATGAGVGAGADTGAGTGADTGAGAGAGESYGGLSWALTRVKEEDWANNWKAYFKPFQVGRRLIIKPTWEAWEKKADQIILEIDPGSSFGTGQHHTTRLCLELLEKHIKPSMKVLDLGCGSGILMTAALLLGAEQAVGVDVEENAMRTARENLEQNGFSADKYMLYCGDFTANKELWRRLGGKAGEAHMITANIVADVILAMAPYFAGFLQPEGKLLVSGIIDQRRPEVLDRLKKAGFALLESGRSGEWNALLFTKAKRE